MEEIGLVHTNETPGRIFKVHSAPQHAGNGPIFMPRRCTVVKDDGCRTGRRILLYEGRLALPAGSRVACVETWNLSRRYSIIGTGKSIYFNLLLVVSLQQTPK